MKPNPAIKTTRVNRRDRQAVADQAVIDRHAAAIAALDAADRTNALIDAIKTLPQTGPRTASHPMATRIDPPQTRGPQEPATAIPDGGVAFIDPPTIRTAQQIVIGLTITGVFLLGLALGKAL